MLVKARVFVYAESNQEYYNRTQRGNREYAVYLGIHEDTEYGIILCVKKRGRIYFI